MLDTRLRNELYCIRYERSGTILFFPYFSMNQPLSRLMAGFVLSFSLAATAAQYYVDSRSGDDTRAGTSPASAWRSLQKVNAFLFQPGDRLGFRAGSALVGAVGR